jgi:hypothetical protein
MPHMPQWRGSVIRFAHDAPHMVSPSAHMQVPAMQTPPAPQSVSQSPQWVGSTRRSTQPPPQSVRAFARNLAPLQLPTLLWDERWSTQAVERAMIDADVSRSKRAEKVDALAAAHILQGAIDALANLPEQH